MGKSKGQGVDCEAFQKWGTQKRPDTERLLFKFDARIESCLERKRSNL